jgi:hypothetical protein
MKRSVKSWIATPEPFGRGSFMLDNSCRRIYQII